MLPASHRLRDKRQFAKLLSRQHKAIHSSFFFLKASTSRQSTSRFAFITTKKIIRKAHDRNYTKRVMRAIIGQLLQSGLVKGTYDTVIFAKKDIREIPYSETFQDLKHGLEKALQ